MWPSSSILIAFAAVVAGVSELPLPLWLLLSAPTSGGRVVQQERARMSVLHAWLGRKRLNYSHGILGRGSWAAYAVHVKREGTSLITLGVQQGRKMCCLHCTQEGEGGNFPCCVPGQDGVKVPA